MENIRGSDTNNWQLEKNRLLKITIVIISNLSLGGKI
ncbi:hypothetical protein FDB72_12630 [Clostridium botulinum]|uniref:Uncharacterized protein n=1 Tax=Clostridium botulinum (strain Hall / ATCC 3502 / NCTC 13319 / Type A) TaxID=441771 RepID=A5I4X4_CLOBH|nr:hypothetical protein DB732_12830 [Clostridium botulinum]CAL84097.1 hypothetical protein CBO2543 [Clostridium botulinum A str. ATCC 3502]AWB31104.1 hypothetical protein DBN47_12825 [Clostridium botulinum]EGT5615313.1 hypothetical protein [Clostridium botulinum]EGT5622164.1 hypothetical protein [Clostridium botulinum]